MSTEQHFEDNKDINLFISHYNFNIVQTASYVAIFHRLVIIRRYIIFNYENQQVKLY